MNVYSRVQMMLFKASQAALLERDEVLAAYGMTMEQARAILDRVPWVGRTLVGAPALMHAYASTAANQAELAGLMRNPVRGLRRIAARRSERMKPRRRRG